MESNILNEVDTDIQSIKIEHLSYRLKRMLLNNVMWQ